MGVYLAVLVFTIQAILLPRVGLSWDEPSSFFVGRSNLKFWLTGNRAYLTDIKNKKLFTDSPFPYIYGEDTYPPFPFLVASATSYIFAENLHLVNVIVAHHLGELVIAALGVWAIYGLATEVGLTALTASAVTLVYALYPTIVDLTRNDAKDVPLMSLLIVASYFFIRTIKAWRTSRKPRLVWGWGLCFALFFGLAEASKPTAAIFVPIVLVWLIVAMLVNKKFAKSIQPLGPLIVLGVSCIVLAIGIFFLVWPALWDNPIVKLGWVWAFFRTVGYNMPVLYFGNVYRAGKNLPREYSFIMLLIQSPIELSILAVVGMLWAVYKFIRKSLVYPMLFVVWFFISLGRFLIPGVLIYEHVRHFIDGMPAYFILAGFGAQAIVVWAKEHLKHFTFVPYLVMVLTLGVVIIHEMYISITYFPYESSYFNAIVGGAHHVADTYLFDIGPSSGVKEAMEAIAKDSGGAQTLVYPCLLGHVAMSYTTPTMKLTATTINGNYTFVPNAMSWFDGAMVFDRDNHQLVYTIRRAGADLFYVYKYKSASGWRCGWETESNYVYQN